MEEYVMSDREMLLGGVKYPLHMSTLTGVFRLSYCVHFFVEDFARHKIAKLAQYSRLSRRAHKHKTGKLLVPGESLTRGLSHTERGRLQRALCRFDQFCQLFNSRPDDIKPEDSYAIRELF
jgi:hypothetical protein